MILLVYKGKIVDRGSAGERGKFGEKRKSNILVNMFCHHQKGKNYFFMV